MHQFVSPSGQTLYYVGKDLKEGPLPTLFYFALAAEQSLLCDPFNQMVVRLQNYPMRIVSVDLPFHGKGMAAADAIGRWAESIQDGIDPLTPFLEQTAESIRSLKEGGYLLEGQVAVAGLSRGAFVAVQIAQRLPWLKTILGFAPLTKLHLAKEMHKLQDHPITLIHDLTLHIDALVDKRLRFYISNRDKRVSTEECFNFISSLAEAAFNAGKRPLAFELIITPPIGHLGHGTSKETFEEGAIWVACAMGLI